jgi:uncharacterized phiE125 gp8 family phage protein
MWYPATITAEASNEPVTLTEAKRQIRAEDFTDDDGHLQFLITVARDHAEKYCNTRFATQTVAVKCDSFADMCRLPEAPVTSVTSISYVDTTGATQTLATSVYELRADGLESSITLKYGQQWPTIQSRSRITVTAVVGYAIAPPAVKNAILLNIADRYANRETARDDNWTAFDSLLCNYRRGG